MYRLGLKPSSLLQIVRDLSDFLPKIEFCSHIWAISAEYSNFIRMLRKTCRIYLNLGTIYGQLHLLLGSAKQVQISL